MDDSSGVMFGVPYHVGVGTILTEEEKAQILAEDAEAKAKLKAELKETLKKELLSFAKDEKRFDEYFDHAFSESYDRIKAFLAWEKDQPTDYMNKLTKKD